MGQGKKVLILDISSLSAAHILPISHAGSLCLTIQTARTDHTPTCTTFLGDHEAGRQALGLRGPQATLQGSLPRVQTGLMLNHSGDRVVPTHSAQPGAPGWLCMCM